MVTVKHCCVCVSLQAGGRMIGYFGIMLVCAVTLISISGFSVKGDFGDAVPSWVIFVSLVAYFVLGMITNSLLVYGSKKEISSLVIPWLVFYAVTVLGAIALAALFIVGARDSVRLSTIVLSVCLLVAIIGFLSYLFLVVYSLLVELRRREGIMRRLRTATREMRSRNNPKYAVEPIA